MPSVPAIELERLVLDRVRKILKAPEVVAQAIRQMVPFCTFTFRVERMLTGNYPDSIRLEKLRAGIPLSSFSAWKMWV